VRGLAPDRPQFADHLDGDGLPGPGAAVEEVQVAEHALVDLAAGLALAAAARAAV